MPLSDVKIRALKPREKQFKTADGEGLYILTKPNGSKLWQMAYKLDGKAKTLSFGAFPKVGLRDARLMREKAKRLLDQGQDPNAAKRKGSKMTVQSNPTDLFKAVAEKWMDTNSHRWVPEYQDRIRSRIVNDVYPEIGDRPIGEIEPVDVLQTIRKVEERGATHMARRIYQMVGSVFRFAVAEGVIKSDPSRDIREALSPKKRSKHRLAIKPSELPKLLSDIEGYQGDAVTKYGLKIVIHTFVRTSELRFARFEEFEDLDGPNPIWRIPEERMKMRREHIVPLSHQVVDLVKEVHRISSDSPWMFPSPVNGKNKPISQNTLIYALYKMGYHSKATTHGFRSTASTVLNEHEWNSDWIEMQLAHVDGSVRGVYNSAKYLNQRREMMQWWSDYLDQPSDDDVFGDLA